MTANRFWFTATAALVVMVAAANWLVRPAALPAVAWALAATFAGAVVGALLLLILRGSPMSMMAATLGRSVVSILGVVLVWLLLEPPTRPLLGAFAIGYLVFLGFETALAWRLNQSGTE